VRSRAEVSFVLELVRAGWNDCEIARETGIPRRTILDWRSGRVPDLDRVRTRPSPYARSCNVCGGDPLRLPQGAYTYLLGLYLGDGCISTHHRHVFRLRIVCANAYPGLIQRCESAMAEVLPDKVSRTPKIGCTESPRTPSTGRACSRSMDPGASTSAGSSWPPGSRSWSTSTHAPWSVAAPLRWVPGAELGERDAVPALPLQQRVGGHPGDLRAGLRPARDRVAPNNPWSLSVARRGSVALLDEFVGPKR
jgi:Homeodomain-like domain